jgi:hypothetical protein
MDKTVLTEGSGCILEAGRDAKKEIPVQSSARSELMENASALKLNSYHHES